MNPLDVAILALACYRAARMIALEDGPFDAFALARGTIDPLQRTWAGRGVNCPLCVGFWAALAMLILWQFQAGQFIVIWLAIAGLQTVIYEVVS